MEKDQFIQDVVSPSPLSPKTQKEKQTHSPRKQNHNNHNNNNDNDRLKRDEWTEAAVSTLLEAYEAKWILRNRAKLKGQDWEDVATHVSRRSTDTKSTKTQTQCKNKIESMKKRYRSESASGNISTWPLYHRLDHLLCGNGSANTIHHVVPLPRQPPPPLRSPLQILQAVNGVTGDGNNHGAKSRDQEPAKNPTDDFDNCTPASYTGKSEQEKRCTPSSESKKNKPVMKRKRGEHREIVDSVRLLAEAVLRCEQGRFETMKEIERMRVEAETKRGEMDLKRTEIIANTQLEIAKLFTTGTTHYST